MSDYKFEYDPNAPVNRYDDEPVLTEEDYKEQPLPMTAERRRKLREIAASNPWP